MMGAAIAYVCAKAGIDVVLKDVTLEAAQRGKGYAERLEAKALQRGRTSEERSAALLGRITPTAEAADFAGVDLVIEAVFESVEVKQAVFGEIVDVVEPDAVLGQQHLDAADHPARRGSRPAGGLRRDPLLLARRQDAARRDRPRRAHRRRRPRQGLRLRPADPQDADRRQRRARLLHLAGHRHVHQRGRGGRRRGRRAGVVEQAALQAGYPTGPLQLMDELTLTLPRKIREETRAAVEAAGGTWTPHPSEAVIDTLIDEDGRTGRSGGAASTSTTSRGPDPAVAGTAQPLRVRDPGSRR